MSSERTFIPSGDMCDHEVYPHDGALPDLVAAMTMERIGIEKALRHRSSSTPLTVRKLSVGREAGTEWAASLKGRAAPSALVSMGFAGGLQEACELGHVILSQTLLAEQETGVLHGDPYLLETAAQGCRQAGIRYHMGPSLTVLRPALKSKEKEGVGIRTGSLSCAMEDYWLAKEAKQAKVPFLSARVVLDEVSQDLPAFVGKLAFTEGVGKALLVLGQVWRLPPLVGLAFQAIRAQKCLGAFAAAFCSALLPATMPQSTLSTGSAS